VRTRPRQVVRLGFAVAVALAAVGPGTTGCSSGPEAPHGSPVLLEVDWVSTTGRSVIFAASADAAVAASVPGGANEIDFVFDRRLDGTRVEDVVGDTSVPKANPPVTVTWPDMGNPPTGIAAEMPFADQVYYNSSPLFGGSTAYVFMRPGLPGFPSATTVTFALDPNGLTSAYGEPMIGPTAIDAMVDPMAVVPSSATAADALETFSASFAFPVRFTNRLPSVADLAPFAHARAGGVDVPVSLAIDPGDPTRLLVSPAACTGGWPAGSVVEVTFDPGLPDAFGVPTTIVLSAGDFMVAPARGDAAAGDAAAPDGGCSAPAGGG